MEPISSSLFLGIIAASLTGTIIFLLRETPVKLFKWLIIRFSVRMELRNDSNTFDAFVAWLGKQPSVQKSQRMAMVTRWNEDIQQVVWTTTIGTGYHFFKFDNKWFMINRVEMESQTREVKEKITVYTLGRDRTIITNMFDEVYNMENCKDKISVNMWTEFRWKKLSSKHPRSFDTIYIDKQLKDDIISDLDEFTNKQEFYNRNGIPYRRGYMFYGPPGTGKTSISMALAGYSSRPLYYLNLSSVTNDKELIRAMTEVPSDAILMIEDIDVAIQTQVRDHENKQKGISLSCLLNTLDGIIATEGRILIVTTNNKDKLDSALIRPGRIDKSFEIGYIKIPEIIDMASNLFNEDIISVPNWQDDVINSLSTIDISTLSPAKAQVAAMSAKDIPDFIDKLK